MTRRSRKITHNVNERHPLKRTEQPKPPTRVDVHLHGGGVLSLAFESETEAESALALVQSNWMNASAILRFGKHIVRPMHISALVFVPDSGLVAG